MIAGRYSLDAEIGRGGMGIVWRGTDEVLGRDVALKRIGLAPGGTSPDLKRAEREARLAATLHHPHVVSVFDLVVDGDEHWLVMEYVESRNLAQIVRDKGPLPQDTAARLLAQVADALAAAHDLGIVHRDVKPSNILVTPSGQAKITDFGIARARADATLTQTGMVTGSPAYLAPEIAAGEQAGPTSDVWSLGATLFHALAGHPPYEVGDNVVGALYRIVHEEPPRLPDAGWLAPVLEATMATDKDARWSMSQVRDVLRGGPHAATPPVPEGETRQFTRTAPLAAPVTATTGTTGTAETAAAAPSPAPEPRIAPEPGRERRGGARAPGSGRRRVGPWVLAAVAVLATVLFAWALSTQDGDDPVAGGPSPSPTQEEQSETPSDSPSESPAEEEGPTEEEMRSFVEDYLATVTSDPGTTWQRLTPGFQEESGGYEAYEQWWTQFESATPGDISADPDRLIVSYGVNYVRKDGSTQSDSVTLQLEQDGDELKIAGES